MNVTLTVTAGPHTGREFVFDRHDTFLVGRSKDSHFQLSYDDPYFSRRHFLVEINPPRVRVYDLNSRNGTMVNGAVVTRQLLQPSRSQVEGVEPAENMALMETMQRPCHTTGEGVSCASRRRC